MRVGLFADRLARGGRTTGVGGYILGISTALSDGPGDHEFVLFSTPESQPVPPGFYGDVTLGTLRWPRRPVHTAWCLTGRPRVNRLGGRLDVLHLLVPSVPVPTDVPLVTTIHDLMPLKSPQFFTRRDRALFRLAVEQVRGVARRVIAISEATRRDVLELLGVPEDRVVVIPYGVPRDLSVPTPNAIAAVTERYGLEGRFILFVGEIAERKDPLGLVEAFDRVAAQSDCTLVLAGPSGRGAADVIERIDHLGLTEQVILLGPIPRDHVAALMAGATIFVLPSLDEGFGLPALEAMAYGCPVVVSDAGSLPEVVGDAGIVVPGRDPDALATALLEMLGDEPRRAEYRRLGRARATSFSWEEAARATMAVYEDAVGC